MDSKVIAVVFAAASAAVLVGVLAAYAWASSPWGVYGWSSNIAPDQRGWWMGGMCGACPYAGAGMGGMMMGGWGMWGSDTQTGQRLTIDEVIQRLEAYVNDLGDNYGILEVMEFTNNFYAVIYERDTGIGAFEVLVNPYTGYITPEPGPNMMWNTKYGHHQSMWPSSTPSGEMSVSPEEASQIALNYLEQRFGQGVEVEKPIVFYGYYTIDYMVNGEMYGMLSVNGYNGDVWPHTWHGQFVQEVEPEEEH